jgi:hypothetical protein
MHASKADNGLQQFQNTQVEHDAEMCLALQKAEEAKRNLAETQKELELQRSDNNELLAKTQSMDAEMSRLQQENDRLLRDLEEATNFLFALHPEQQVSDDEVRKRYKSLCDSIETWVENATYGGSCQEFYSRFSNIWPKRDKFPPFLNAAGKSIYRTTIADLSRYDNFDCFILTVLIQELLDAELFRYDYPIGFSRSHTNFVESLLRSMIRSNPSKGQLHIPFLSISTKNPLLPS